MVTTFQPTIGAVGKIFKVVFELIANIFGALVPVFNVLAAVLNPVVDIVAEFVRFLGGVLNPLLMMVGMLISFVLDTIMTFTGLYFLLELIGAGAKKMSDGIDAMLEGIADFGEGLAEIMRGFAKFIEGLGSFLEDWGLENPMAGIVSSINKFANNIENATSGLGSFGRGMDETIAEMDRENKMREEANKEASKVLNAPKGFKVEKYRYEAMSTQRENPFMTGSSDSGSVQNIVIEYINVEDKQGLLEMMREAQRTGGFNPLGGG